jgi:alpha-ketoglutarate-dependent taurine dioxygenase
MSTDASTWSSLEIKRVAGHIGADISGVDLSKPLDGITLAEIRAALLTHKVIFFRGQQLSHAEHVALGRQFGELTRRSGNKHGAHPDGFPQILTIDPESDDERYGRNFERRYRQKQLTSDSGWHTDLTPAVNPPAICILRAEVVPAFGGDTQWANLVAAYEGLSKPLQKLADGLRAEHAFFAGCQMLQSDPEDVKVTQKHADDTLISVHPVVRVHPETGEKHSSCSPRQRPGSSASPLRRAVASSSCSSNRSRVLNTLCGFAGNPATSLSGTTGQRPTLPRPTWTTRTTAARCTG